MTTQAQAPPPNLDLVAARELLNELQTVTRGADADPQTKAVTAAAHSILVLAEQVAAIRVLMVGDAVARRAENQPEPQATENQPEPQDNKPPKKRRWR